MSRKIALRRSPIHGNGVFALVDLPAGEELIEYKGRLLTHAQADKAYAHTGDSGHTFLFTLNDQYVIDANRGGNVARWINHSCAPNCRAVLQEDETGDRRKDKVFIETVKPVKAGTELTYNYGITLEVPHTPAMKRIWQCRCGAKNCTGTLLQKKRK